MRREVASLLGCYTVSISKQITHSYYYLPVNTVKHLQRLQQQCSENLKSHMTSDPNWCQTSEELSTGNTCVPVQQRYSEGT